MPHSFAWEVKDEPSKNDYSHQQESDGKVTTGSYRVALPDGRTQIVTYTADQNGYVAKVKYEGEAQYPAPSSYNNKPSASYQTEQAKPTTAAYPVAWMARTTEAQRSLDEPMHFLQFLNAFSVVS